MLNCFVLFLSFTEVTSAPVPPSIIDTMTNDSNICSTAKFLYDSEYIKPCAVIEYPTTPWNYSLPNLNNFLCLGVYDTAYKICQYSSQIVLNSTTINSNVKKYIPSDNAAQKNFCNNLKGFTSLYGKIDSFWKQLVESLNTPHNCEKICFDLEDKLHPLCAVFAWIKNYDDMMIAKKVEAKPDLMATDKPRMTQSKDEITSDAKTTLESKPVEIKKSKEQNEKQTITDSNNNNAKEGNSNIPGNADVTFDEEKTKSDTRKGINQKKINNTLEKQTHKSVPSEFKENKENIDAEFDTNAAVEKSMKNIPSSNAQVPSINKSINDINKNALNEGTAEKSNKEQNIDLKPSTLSENTQDHYDAENPEENMENDIDGINTCKAQVLRL